MESGKQSHVHRPKVAVPTCKTPKKSLATGGVSASIPLRPVRSSPIPPDHPYAPWDWFLATPRIRIQSAPHSSLRGLGHRGESIEFSACARDLRSSADPENRSSSANAQKSGKSSLARFCYVRKIANPEDARGTAVPRVAAPLRRQITTFADTEPAGALRRPRTFVLSTSVVAMHS
jgi:hypothetical protein